MKTLIKHLSYEDINYVIDLSAVLDKKNHLAVYFGYPSLSAESKLIDIRKYACNDWSKNTSDDEMILILNKFICEDKMMQEECKLVNYQYFDTSYNLLETILKVADYINLNI